MGDDGEGARDETTTATVLELAPEEAVQIVNVDVRSSLRLSFTASLQFYTRCYIAEEVEDHAAFCFFSWKLTSFIPHWKKNHSTVCRWDLAQLSVER